MRLLSPIMGCALALSLAACGTQSDKKTEQAQQAKPEVAAAPATNAEIPAAMVLRVPVDADGKATGMPEMKVLKTGKVEDSADSVVAAFANGDVAKVGELDADSSTQSWSAYAGFSSSYGSNYNSSYGGGYGNSGYGNSYGGSSYGGGYGGSYGCGSYCSSYNQSYFYNSYSPTLYYGNQQYNYGSYRPYSYNNGGYNYYCYRPSYGYGGGYGGGY